MRRVASQDEEAGSDLSSASPPAPRLGGTGTASLTTFRLSALAFAALPPVTGLDTNVYPPPHHIGAGVRPPRALDPGDCGLRGDQSGIPVAAQHLEHAHLHRRTWPYRPRHDAFDDGGRIRSLRGLRVRLRAGRDVDALQCGGDLPVRRFRGRAFL